MDRLSTCVPDMQHYPCLPLFWIARCLVKSEKQSNKKMRGGIWYPYHIYIYIYKITKMESDERAQRKWRNALKLTEYDSFKANSIQSTVWVQHQRAKRAKTPCTPPTLSLAPYTLLSFSLLWVRWWMCMSISVSINSLVQGWRCQGWGGMRSFTLSLTLS